MERIKKNLSNILFFGFLLFLFTPWGMPVRSLMIKAVSKVTTAVVSLEIPAEERTALASWTYPLVDAQGQAVDFQALQGKVVLVNLWASWCPPCRAEMPSMQALYDDYQDEVVFLFIAREEPEKSLAYLEQKDLNLPVYFERAQAPEALRSNSLPTTYILDQEGRIAAEKTGAADWNSSKVRDLLDRLLAGN